MTEKQTQQLLDELYAIDDSLRQHEQELRATINALLSARPEPKINSLFRAQLRKKLLDRVSQAQNASTVRTNPVGFLSFMNKLNFKMAGSVLVLLLLTPLLYYANDKGYFASKQNDLMPEIVSVGDQAFGSLANQGGPMEGDNPASSYDARGGAGGLQKEISSIGGEGMGGDARIAIAPYPYYIYKYAYKGDAITLEGGNVDVLRRVRGSDAISSLDSLLNRLDLGLINLSSFRNLKLQNVNLKEDGNRFNVFIDLNEGSISIHREYGPDTPIMLKAPSQGLRPEDIPAESMLIEIAKRFLADHGIPTENYGPPEIMDEWRVQYERLPAAERLQIYLPESISVVFPLVINGEKVYEEGGNVAGLSVQVNVREKRADGFWNLTVQRYEKSKYKAVSDAQKILAAVEKGTFRNYGYGLEMLAIEPVDLQPQVKEVEVGTPIRGQIRLWNYANNQNQELIVPALVFPITKTPADDPYFWQKHIVIPLAEEFFNQNDGGPIRIMEDKTDSSMSR